MKRTTFSYPILDQIITKETIIEAVNQLWVDVLKIRNFDPSKNFIRVICKANFIEESMAYRSLSDMLPLNISNEDKLYFIERILKRYSRLDEGYHSYPINELTFDLIIFKGQAPLISNRPTDGRTYKDHKFNNLNFPISMQPSDYGQVILSNLLPNGYTRYVVQNLPRVYQIDVSPDKKVNESSILDIEGYVWKDTVTDNDLPHSFMREIKKSTIYFAGGVEVLRKQQLSAEPFTKSRPAKSLKTEFLTWDIETVSVPKWIGRIVSSFDSVVKLLPYCVSVSKGTKTLTTTTFNLSESGREQLFDNFISNLFKISKGFKTKKISIFAHNSGRFDSIFILNSLMRHGKIELLTREGTIIYIKFIPSSKEAKGRVFVFKDSHQLMPSSLRSLGKGMGVEVNKGFFPITYTKINHVGALPAFEFWGKDITISDYNKMQSEWHGKEWNFMEQAVKYCEIDCISLHQIIGVFNKLIFDEFGVNVLKEYTLSGVNYEDI